MADELHTNPTPETQQTGGEPNAENNAQAERVVHEPEPAAAQASAPGTDGGGAPAADGTQEPAAGGAAPGGAAAGSAEPAAAAQGAQATDAAPADQTADEPAAEPAAKPAAEDTRAQQAVDKLAGALAKAALSAAGVPAERIDRALRLMDVRDADPLADDAAAKYETAAKTLVAEIPELLPAAAGTTGSSGEHARRQQDTTDPFTRGFRSR